MRLPTLALTLFLATPAAADDITVFAAASLKTALDQIATEFQATTGHTVTLSFAASNTLAQQILQGAPADIFLSASPEWMDLLAEKNLIQPASRIPLLGNTLVLIAHDPNATPVALPTLNPATLLGADGKLAMAMTASVPAGIYGKQALTSLGLWPKFEPHIAQTDNVRAALRLVAIGEAPAGIVYASDARAEPGVTIIATFPADTHDPIIYPAALIGPSPKPAAAAFLTALTQAPAAQVFTDQGFTVLAQ